MKIINLIRNWIDYIQVTAMRRQVLNRKLDGLTDPTFLDRAVGGDKDL